MSEPPAQRDGGTDRDGPAAPHDAYAALLTQELRLPVAAILYDGGGAEVARHRFGTLQRSQSVALAADAMAR